MYGIVANIILDEKSFGRTGFVIGKVADTTFACIPNRVAANDAGCSGADPVAKRSMDDVIENLCVSGNIVDTMIFVAVTSVINGVIFNNQVIVIGIIGHVLFGDDSIAAGVVNGIASMTTFSVPHPLLEPSSIPGPPVAPATL